MTSLQWTIISFAAIQVLSLGVFIGTVRATISAVKEDIRDIPKVINGTVVRAHENRCCNYTPHRADPTNPGIRLGA
jgi:hypothetical protein